MTKQIAVKLPDNVLLDVDRLVEDGVFGSRSDAVRSALNAMLRQARSDRIDRAFAEGFRRHPESPSELAEAERLAIEAIEDEPWERWW